MRIPRALVFLAALFAAAPTLAQNTLLQGGPWAPGHVPQYTGQGGQFSQPVVIDGGGSGGGGLGVNLSEIGIISRDPLNNYPSVNSGNGPYGSHFCMYDAPTTNATGYHYLCLDPNAQGGGLLSYGAGGAATQLPMQTDINGVLGTIGGGGGSTSLTIGTTPVSGAPAGAFLTSNGSTLEYSVGTPVIAAVPTGSYAGYFAYTYTGTGNVTLIAYGGQGIPGFTAANQNNDIVCTGIGGLENQAYAGVISTVVNSTTVTLTPAPTIPMTGISQRCAFGPDQTTNLQNTFNLGQTNGVGSYVPGGIYLVNSGLSCQPPANYNNLTAGPPLCQLAQGAYVLYAGTGLAQNLMTYGSATAILFTGRINYSEITGGTFDGNFNVNNDVDLDFFFALTRRNQTTKNALQHQVVAGNTSTLPTASSGLLDIGNFGARDVNYVPITNVTSASPAVVTTAYPHGFTTGRVVFFIGTNGTQTGLNTNWWQITVIDSTHFSLNNSNLTGTAATSGNVAQTMPSMAIEQPVFAVTNANPAVITAPAGTVTLAQSGSQFFIADLGMVNAAGTQNCIDGTFTVTYLTTTTFSIPVNSSSCTSFTGGGHIIPAPQFNTLESFLYNANATDEQTWGDEFYGIRIGVVNNSTTSGYDGKWQFHDFNYFQNGELLASFYGGGANNFIGLQTDCPARFAVWLTGAFNYSTGSEMNCGAFSQLENNVTSYARLESNATFIQHGGLVEGAPGSAVLQLVSSPYAIGGQFGRIVGYNAFAVAQFYVTYAQPDSNPLASFQTFSSTNSAVIQAVSTSGGGVGLIEAYDTNTGDYGLEMTSGAGNAALNVMTNTGAFGATALFANTTLLDLALPVQFGASSSFTANGAVATTMTSLGPTGSHTTIQEWLTVKDSAGTTRYIPAY